MRRGFWLARAVKMVVLVIIAVGVLSFVTMSLWNWLVPALFAGPLVSYWQALGLLVLSRLLFGGLRPHGGGRFGHWHHARAHWKQMTPEEREHIRNRFREGRHGCHGRWGESPEPSEPGPSAPKA